jgi:hypothetical protein
MLSRAAGSFFLAGVRYSGLRQRRPGNRATSLSEGSPLCFRDKIFDLELIDELVQLARKVSVEVPKFNACRQLERSSSFALGMDDETQDRNGNSWS